MLPLHRAPESSFAPKDSDGKWMTAICATIPANERVRAALAMIAPFQGPYKQEVRENWLRELLEVKRIHLRDRIRTTPKDIEADLTAELEEIRRI